MSDMATRWDKTIFISDTHGFYDVWTRLFRDLGLIDANNKWIAGPRVRLVHLGDHTDRGEDSVGLYRLIMGLQAELGPEQVVVLLGNHDLQYVGGPWFGTEGRIENELAADMRADLEAGRTQFAWRFETEGGDEWLCVHAGLDARWEDLHNKPMQEVVDFINAEATSGKLSPSIRGCGPDAAVVQAVGTSRGGWDRIPGVAWCDFWLDLRPGEYLLTHKQIVGHTIQPKGVQLSSQGKLWGVNVHYDHAQALIYDHATDTFEASHHLAPEGSPYVEDVRKAMDGEVKRLSDDDWDLLSCFIV